MKWQLEQIVKELLLLQGHASDPTCPCDTEGEFCVRKHLLMIEALAQETVPIATDGEQKESLAKLASEARTQRNEEELSLCRPDEPSPDLVDWARQWRKEFEEVSIACPVPGAVEATLYRIDLQEDEVATVCEMVSSPYRELVIFFQLAEQERLLFDTEKGEGKGKIDEIMQKLQQGVKEIWESTNYQDYLLTMAKFHHYSLGNIMLIRMQRPDATRVAGFNRWRELERQVKKGEKGIAILAPCWQGAGKRAVLSEVAPGTKVKIGSLVVLVGQRVNGNIAVTEMDTGAVNHFPADTLVTIVGMEAMTGSPIYFKVVYVFDIKQTEGKELPTWEVPTLTAEVSEELWQKVLDFTASKKVTLSFEPMPDQDPEIKGWCNMKTGEIWIKPDESRAQQTKTLIHEDAHHLTGLVPGLAEKDHETIAESVAFVVSAHFGFDTGVRSFPYVAVWAKEAEVLKRNLEAVRKLSAQMIDEMETLHRREPMAAPYPTGCELADLIRDSCHTESPWRGSKSCNAYITELFGQTCRGHAPGSSLATAKLSRREAAVSENPGQKADFISDIIVYELDFGLIRDDPDDIKVRAKTLFSENLDFLEKTMRAYMIRKYGRRRGAEKAVSEAKGGNPGNPWTPPKGAIDHGAYYEIDGSFVSKVHDIYLSHCEVEHGLAGKLDRCVTEVQERNVEAGCPAEGLGTAECPLSYAICRATISQPICPPKD